MLDVDHGHRISVAIRRRPQTRENFFDGCTPTNVREQLLKLRLAQHLLYFLSFMTRPMIPGKPP